MSQATSMNPIIDAAFDYARNTLMQTSTEDTKVYRNGNWVDSTVTKKKFKVPDRWDIDPSDREDMIKQAVSVAIVSIAYALKSKLGGDTDTEGLRNFLREGYGLVGQFTE